MLDLKSALWVDEEAVVEEEADVEFTVVVEVCQDAGVGLDAAAFSAAAWAALASSDLDMDSAWAAASDAASEAVAGSFLAQAASISAALKAITREMEILVSFFIAENYGDDNW